MKKLAVFVGAGVLMVSMAGVVLGRGKPRPPKPEPVVVTNWANVDNKVTTVANTGDNELKARYSIRGGKIYTGAATAVSSVSNMVNYNEILCSDCDGKVTVNNWGNLKNRVYTLADSGDNTISAKCVGGGLIKTGEAYAVSVVENAINFNLVGAAME